MISDNDRVCVFLNIACTFCPIWALFSCCFCPLPLVGVIGPVVCVGFGLGRTCVCILVGGGEFSFFSRLMGKAIQGDVFWGVCGKSL